MTNTTEESNINAQELIQQGAVNQGLLDFLRGNVKTGASIIISGNPSSGKTTYLNAIIEQDVNKDRIIIEEGIDEPRTPGRHRAEHPTEKFVSKNLKDFLSTALRNKEFTKIIVGEAKEATYDNFSVEHDASNAPGRSAIATLTATDINKTIQKLATLSTGSETNHTLITEAVDIIIEVKQYEDNSRRIAAVYSVKKNASKESHVELDLLYKLILDGTDEAGNLTSYYESYTTETE